MLEFMWWKFWILVFLAFCYGIYRGFTGQPLARGPRDSRTAPKDLK
jgi:hypothetical protein